MVQAGVIVTDYATVAVEMLKDNASLKAGDLYAALDMPWAGLVGHHNIYRLGYVSGHSLFL
jgi:hypothetical protein